MKKFSADARVLAVLQSLGQMGFVDYDRNYKLCMENHSNLDVILDKLMQ